MKKTICTIGALLILSGFLAAQQPEMAIRFYNKSLYYLDSEILLKVTLTNRGDDQLTIDLPQNRFHSLSFTVSDLKNNELPPPEKFTRERTSAQPVYYREFTLMPDEEYGFIVNLRDFIQIDTPGTYTVNSHFAAKIGNSDDRIKHRSNELMLMVRPGHSEMAYQDRIDEETSELLRKKDLSPDKVIRYMLDARLQDQWNRFTLYIDLEELYKKDFLREREFRLLSEEERLRRIREYKAGFKDEPLQQLLIERPSSYEIIRTEYTSDEARVIVRAHFKGRDFDEVRLYTYILHRPDNYWTMKDYYVTNEGAN